MKPKKAEGAGNDQLLWKLGIRLKSFIHSYRFATLFSL